jgi:hypothetical protein
MKAHNDGITLKLEKATRLSQLFNTAYGSDGANRDAIRPDAEMKPALPVEGTAGRTGP